MGLAFSAGQDVDQDAGAVAMDDEAARVKHAHGRFQMAGSQAQLHLSAQGRLAAAGRRPSRLGPICLAA